MLGDAYLAGVGAETGSASASAAAASRRGRGGRREEGGGDVMRRRPPRAESIFPTTPSRFASLSSIFSGFLFFFLVFPLFVRSLCETANTREEKGVGLW